MGRSNRAHAQASVCWRTAARSPSKRRVAVVMLPFTFQPNHTVPTGLSAVPPVGPAMHR